MSDNKPFSLEMLFGKLKERTSKENKNSYTSYLLNIDRDLLSKKLMEEAFELSSANIESARLKNKSHITEEAADLIYHLLVILLSRKIEFTDVLKELENRSKRKK